MFSQDPERQLIEQLGAFPIAMELIPLFTSHDMCKGIVPYADLICKSNFRTATNKNNAKNTYNNAHDSRTQTLEVLTLKK